MGRSGDKAESEEAPIFEEQTFQFFLDFTKKELQVLAGLSYGEFCTLTMQGADVWGFFSTLKSDNKIKALTRDEFNQLQKKLKGAIFSPGAIFLSDGTKLVIESPRTISPSPPEKEVKANSKPRPSGTRLLGIFFAAAAVFTLATTGI